MATINQPTFVVESANAIRDQWLERLSALVKDVQEWATDLGWSTRQIETKLEDSEIGAYEAPALLLQMETTRVLLEPITRSAPGADGVVDLYVMPAYDDIASFYFVDDEWRLHHTVTPSPGGASVRDGRSVILSKATLQNVLEGMRQNAAHAV
ncbi:MAG: hypothetical protein IAG10_06930 [Planctomycetaceae bacterium]|nr:hypothetical protein [Planctomycetaceae bacterium]